MREHDDTQAIFREISEIKNLMSNHIIETNTYRKERDKVVDSHSELLWDSREKPGLATRVDRMEQIEVSRKWTIRAIASALIVGIADKFFHIFK